MAIVMDGFHLTIEDVNRISRNNEKIEMHPDSLERIKKCRAMLDKKIIAREIMYGVNTGIGEFSEVVLTDEQVGQYQKYLIYSHAAGCGEPMDERDVRAAIASRVNVHCHGNSGQRPEITDLMIGMLNAGVNPVMFQHGSVGACGDLSPMSQFALVLMGEWEAFYKGERMTALQALERAGLKPEALQARDGLAAINGSNCILGMGCNMLWEIERWVKTHDIAAAMTLEALKANMKPYDERIHQLRGFPGAVTAAGNINRVTEGSDILKAKGKKVQDAYSMRSTPQVVGSAYDGLKYAREQFHVELNGVGDNPVFIPDDDTVLTGANFQGTPLAFPLELMGLAVSTVSVLSERRMNRLMNPALSVGLPAFLSKGAGMMSGMMLTQYTAGMLLCEQRILSHPAANGSIPAAADQEDFVSMGMTTAIKTRQILNHAYTVLAIELMAATQALDFRELNPGKGTQAAREVVRKHFEFLDDDRPLFEDINRVSAAVRDWEVLDAVESAIGELGSVEK
ncbi:MAG: aromatic amino acid lyase [Planctomycetota bacterium]|nr:MAG: aromatic amino acid lyase [Planctomycetota bacterium]